MVYPLELFEDKGVYVGKGPFMDQQGTHRFSVPLFDVLLQSLHPNSEHFSEQTNVPMTSISSSAKLSRTPQWLLLLKLLRLTFSRV